MRQRITRYLNIYDINICVKTVVLEVPITPINTVFRVLCEIKCAITFKLHTFSVIAHALIPPVRCAHSQFMTASGLKSAIATVVHSYDGQFQQVEMDESKFFSD